ncbi:MAG: hypothetical protein ACWA5T_00815 [Parvularcula sp.]
MVIYAVIVFAVAALGGLYLASHVLRDKFAPWPVSLLHAGLGALGLGLLGAAIIQGGASQGVLIGFVVLLVAALGGFFLASFHLRNQMPPKVIVGVHAVVAIIGFLTIAMQVL